MATSHSQVQLQRLLWVFTTFTLLYRFNISVSDSLYDFESSWLVHTVTLHELLLF